MKYSVNPTNGESAQRRSSVCLQTAPDIRESNSDLRSLYFHALVQWPGIHDRFSVGRAQSPQGKPLTHFRLAMRVKILWVPNVYRHSDARVRQLPGG